MSNKVLMIVNTDGALYIFRMPIIRKLILLGHQVVSISSKSGYFHLLEKIGVKPIALDFFRHSVSPVQNLSLIIRLFRLIKQQSPDVVHNFTHKPAIYGTVAAWLAGVRRIYVTITGLGILFVNNDLKSCVFRELLILQYRIALRLVHTVFFQNSDDRNYFLHRRILNREQAILTNGSGIDLEEFGVPGEVERKRARAMLSAELGQDLAQRQVVLFPARGVREKGFFEFYEAARMLSEHAPTRFVFLHLGLVDQAVPGHVSHHGIDALAEQSHVYYLGFKDNIRDYMMASDIVALPSYYREGVPRSLIEALALGRTIVTTDAPGCRETVIDGWNGYFCEPRSAESLAAQLEKATPAFCAVSFERSRKLCEDKFDARRLVQVTLDRYEQ